MVTIEDLFAQITAQLQEAGCEDPAFDARCLMEDLAGLPHGRDIRLPDNPLSAEQEQRVRQAAGERAAGRPLQYILGEWDFLDMTLRVGEGVLIPRSDTELLCETAAQRLRRQAGSLEVSLPVLDLCAGSGCVGLGVAPGSDGDGDGGRAVGGGVSLFGGEYPTISELFGPGGPGRCAAAG